MTFITTLLTWLAALFTLALLHDLRQTPPLARGRGTPHVLPTR